MKYNRKSLILQYLNLSFAERIILFSKIRSVGALYSWEQSIIICLQFLVVKARYKFGYIARCFGTYIFRIFKMLTFRLLFGILSIHDMFCFLLFRHNKKDWSYSRRTKPSMERGMKENEFICLLFCYTNRLLLL